MNLTQEDIKNLIEIVYNVELESITDLEITKNLVLKLRKIGAELKNETPLMLKIHEVENIRNVYRKLVDADREMEEPVFLLEDLNNESSYNIDLLEKLESLSKKVNLPKNNFL